jgi:EmrB/QacA subfamily drug resistance transporter
VSEATGGGSSAPYQHAPDGGAALAAGQGGAAVTGKAEAGQPAAGGDSGFLSHREIMIALPGLLLAILLSMLDQLVVGTALPRIVGDLGGVSHLSWVVTAYTLTSTITTPFYGKLGDMYGRKKLFIFSIVVFLAGSALSGLSASMAQLIMFRALQGLGAGGLMVSAMAVIGEIVPPRERGKYMSYMMVVMMLATVGGPLVGGWITESISWRWIFYINLPVGGAALVYMITTLKLPRRRVEHRVDYLGGGLLAIIATAIILIATWGGTEYSWGSAEVTGLMAATVVALAAFLYVESRAQEPMMPLHVFANRNFSLSMVLVFFVGLGLFGAMTFLPLYQQTVQGASPIVSGLLLTPLMAGSMVTSVLSGQLVTKTGKYRLYPVLGGAIMAVAMFALTKLGTHTTMLQSSLYYVVLGLGMGFLMQMVSLIAQNSAELKDQGVASSARMFFQQIGGSLGVAAFGALFASRLDSFMAAASAGRGGPRIAVSGGSLDPAQVTSLPPAVRQVVFGAISHGIDDVFWAVLPTAIAVFAVALFIKHVPLRGRGGPGEESAIHQTELAA